MFHVLPISPGQNDLGHLRTVSAEHLLFDTADRGYPASQRDLEVRKREWFQNV